VSKRLTGWLGDLMRETGKTRRELLVLSDASDPFYAGTTPTQKKWAEWFARMWEQEYKGRTGIHIRRCHYHIDAIGFLKINGMPYTNTRRDWGWLCEASKWARILKLVPADAFEDRRNADPYPLNWRTAELGQPTVFGTEQYGWWLPSLSSSEWTLRTPRVSGYAPDDYLDRAYLLEVWIEKSTMDDILEPLCKELRVQLVPAAGFQSISNIVKLLQRIREIGKPARIFYISDYDKQGRGMPVQVARHLEYWRQHYAPDSDIKLDNLVLTKEQIKLYNLPSNTDKKKKGAVELDALEAIVPGELEKIVRAAIAPYLDESIDDRLDEAKRKAEKNAQQKWSRLMAPHKQTLEELNEQVNEIREKYQKLLERELEPFKEPLARLEGDVEQAASKFRANLPDRPTQEVREQNEQEWLFDSARSYLEQLAFYKKQQKQKG
jgi:hypothetical protein